MKFFFGVDRINGFNDETGETDGIAEVNPLLIPGVMVSECHHAFRLSIFHGCAQTRCKPSRKSLLESPRDLFSMISGILGVYSGLKLS